MRVFDGVVAESLGVANVRTEEKNKEKLNKKKRKEEEAEER